MNYTYMCMFNYCSNELVIAMCQTSVLVPTASVCCTSCLTLYILCLYAQITKLAPDEMDQDCVCVEKRNSDLQVSSL